jgi:hypothetical protein
MDDLISREEAIKRATADHDFYRGATLPTDKARRDELLNVMCWLNELLSAQPEEVIPHRNYNYLSDYWCECGWHLGKKGEVKYCSECGRKVNWDE